jgi:hypothetical protein
MRVARVRLRRDAPPAAPRALAPAPLRLPDAPPSGGGRGAPLTLAYALSKGPNAGAAQALSVGGLPRLFAQALLAGVAVPRSPAPEGVAGVLRPEQARRLAERLARLPDRKPLERVLALAAFPSAGGAAPQIAQALVLKAWLAGRSLVELETFARAIAGMEQRAMCRATTLLDVDTRKNTSRLRTERLDPHVPAAPLGGDRLPDNDGFLQAYDSSCGPACASVLLGEADPLFAFAVHAAGGLQAVGNDNPAQALQAAWLGDFGDPLRRRGADYTYRVVSARTRELVARRQLNAGDRFALLAYLRSPNAALTPSAQRGLAASGLSAAEVATMRAGSPAAETWGSDGHQMRRLLDREVVGKLGGRGFTVHRGASIVKRRMDELAACASTTGVILGTKDHWWAITDARRDASGAWTFLVHDTWLGVTAWVPAAELADGTFPRTQFRWPRRGEIDTLLLTR